MAKKKAPAACCGRPARVGKSIVRNASKSMEKTMIKQATSLYDDPFKVLPTYEDAESEKRFRKIRKQLQKVDNEKDNVKKLEKLAKKRNLTGAVAGTLLIAHAKKAPFLAAAKLPTGIINYAQRGLAPKEYLIAAQNTNDPLYRIFGIQDIALKYHLHIYSWDDGFVSTGLNAQPPKEFVDFVINTLEYKREKNSIHCDHLSKEIIDNKTVANTPYLHMKWHSANVTLGICQQCASKKNNTLFNLTKYLLAEDISEDFTLRVIGSIVKGKQSGNEVETLFLDDYFSGKLSDEQFIQKNMDHRREQLQDLDTAVYILNGKNFDSAEEFIDALHPNDQEKHALHKLLYLHQKPVVVKDVTPNDVLEQYWKDYGFDVIKDITNDDTITNEILSLSETPTVMIKTAFQIKKKRDVIQLLPDYDSLPDIAEYADKLARIYRIEGKDKLVSTLRSIPNHPKKKAIAFAMLLAINKQADVKWKFSKIEIESGDFIKPYIETLLKGDPDTYHNSLQEVYNASGFSESLDSYKK